MFKMKCMVACAVLSTVILFSEAISITIEWEPAQTTVNGEPLEDIHYYKLFYGTTSGIYSDYITVTNGTSVRLSNLGYNKTLYFCVRTCSGSTESDYSEELFWIAPVMPDADYDGLSDDWEAFYFGSLSRAGSSTDSDGNGIADLDEFVAGTDPVNPNDYSTVEVSSDGNVYFVARRATGSGYENRTRKYRLLYSSSIEEGDWIPVMENIEADNQIVSHSLSGNEPFGYYRTETYLD